MTEQISKHPFEQLEEEVGKGIIGENESITIGLPKLGKYANFRRGIFTLIFSSTGAGKSSLVDTMMLNACDDMMKKGEKKAKFILFSMERSKHLRVAKWIIRKIFLDHKVEIPLPKLLGWWDLKMTKDEHDLFLMYRDYISTLLEDYIDIHDGAKTPNEVYHIMKEYFSSTGIYEKQGEHKTIYLANDESKLCIPILDHGSLLRTTKDFSTKKASIDATVQYMQRFRTVENASPVWISQVNRQISSITATKDLELELSLDHVKESGDIGDAADLAISLYNPIKFNQSSKTGYNPTDFVDRTTGANYFRSVQIVKSTYGMDDLRLPLCFNGFCGDFSELPKRKDLDEQQYKSLINNVLSKQYFLK